MWLSQAVYTLLEQQLTEARARIAVLEEALELERHENRKAERHWSNALLRARQAFPQVEEKSPLLTAVPREPELDPGELAALEDEARRIGIDPALAREVLLKEQVIP